MLSRSSQKLFGFIIFLFACLSSSSIFATCIDTDNGLSSCSEDNKPASATPNIFEAKDKIIVFKDLQSFMVDYAHYHPDFDQNVDPSHVVVVDQGQTTPARVLNTVRVKKVNHKRKLVRVVVKYNKLGKFCNVQDVVMDPAPKFLPIYKPGYDVAIHEKYDVTHCPSPKPSSDQCDTTNQCKDIFGPQATDCLNSPSDESVCMCGHEECKLPKPSADQCDTTSQCKEIYGSQATDCLNSPSDESVCMCGHEACADLNNNDQCDTTNECREIFGPHATDCLNSPSDSSVCMCGEYECGFRLMPVVSIEPSILDK